MYTDHRKQIDTAQETFKRQPRNRDDPTNQENASYCVAVAVIEMKKLLEVVHAKIEVCGILTI